MGVSMSVTAFPVLAPILVERRMLRRPVGALCLASSAIDDVTAWGLLALALAVTGSGNGLHALTIIGWTVLFVVAMVLFARPFLGRAAVGYAEVGQLPWFGSERSLSVFSWRRLRRSAQASHPSSEPSSLVR